MYILYCLQYLCERIICFNLGCPGEVDGERWSDAHQEGPQLHDLANATRSFTQIQDSADIPVHVGNEANGHHCEGIYCTRLNHMGCS